TPQVGPELLRDGFAILRRVGGVVLEADRAKDQHSLKLGFEVHPVVAPTLRAPRSNVIVFTQEGQERAAHSLALQLALKPGTQPFVGCAWVCHRRVPIRSSA